LLGGGIDERDGHDDDQHDGAGLLELERADDLPQQLPDPSGAHQPDDGRGPHVAFEAVKRIADPERHHLRNDAIDDLLDAARAGGPDTLDRVRIDRLDRLGEQLG